MKSFHPDFMLNAELEFLRDLLQAKLICKHPLIFIISSHLNSGGNRIGPVCEGVIVCVHPPCLLFGVLMAELVDRLEIWNGDVP